MKYTLLTKCCCTIILLFSFCNGNNEKNDSLISIDIESNIENFNELLLSQFNAEVHYVLLKNEKNLEISRIRQIDVTSDLLLVCSINLCLLYDYSGTIITKIGEEGRGPNEYNSISSIGFGFNKNIYIQSSGNFLEFNTDGSILNSTDLNKEKNPIFYRPCWISINDSLFLGHIPNFTGHEENKAILFDKNGNIKHKFKNYTYLNRENFSINSNDWHASFYYYKNKMHFKEKMNDTLFYLTDKFELLPLFSFKIGKYAIPKEYRERPNLIGFNPFGYIFLNNVFEMSNFLLLDCSFGKFTPAKRITPREVNGQLTWYNTAKVLGLYSKESKSLVFCKPTSTDNALFTTGFYNDIDAGPRFYPVKQVNDSTLVMWIEAKQFKDHIASDDFKNNVPKFPEKKKELEELANKLTIFDNPVLMFVTFKK